MRVEDLLRRVTASSLFDCDVEQVVEAGTIALACVELGVRLEEGGLYLVV
jgi:hypothetical protein